MTNDSKRRVFYESPVHLAGWRDFSRLVRCKLAHSTSGTDVEEWDDGPLRRKRSVSWCLECGRPLDTSRVINYQDRA